MSGSGVNAPGWPGIIPRWTSSAKTGVGTSLDKNSNIWFTVSHGIINEVFYPLIDNACIRDMGMLVTDGGDFFSEEKRDTKSITEWLEEGVPIFWLVNTCLEQRYRIEKTVLSDPERSTIIQQTKFLPLAGGFKDYHLYVILAPHLDNHGYGNSAWIDYTQDGHVLFAQRGSTALALSCSSPWLKSSVGYVGYSDGWQDLKSHKKLTSEYSRAENGNVAITAEIDLASTGGSFTIALGLGLTHGQAYRHSLESLSKDFSETKRIYRAEWCSWRNTLVLPDVAGTGGRDLSAVSAAVLRVHESKLIEGGIIASLSIPWGDAKSDDDLGGYHLVWPRDLVEAAEALIAIGAKSDAKRVLYFLKKTQNPDGHWTQNLWIDGRPYWNSIQLDESAFPILLAEMARKENLLEINELENFWPMIFGAARFITATGPVTVQDRWEEDSGYSPFTLAASIAALLAAADIADELQQPCFAKYFRDVADFWNASIERWCYVKADEFYRETGALGYYVRLTPPDRAESYSPEKGYVPIKNRPPGTSDEPVSEIVSADALSLVRFGLRKPDDPRITDTIKVIDSVLKADLPGGTSWYRYNNDGYGEQKDGSPFTGTGIGRPWPILAGERGHYELAAGNTPEALRLLHSMENFAGKSGLIPEQVWDNDDIPEKELCKGKPSHSANPLVWAHAEYLKLRRSLHDGKIFDMPYQASERYKKGYSYRYHIWRFNHKCRGIPAGKILRIEVMAHAIIRWTSDGWKTINDTSAANSCLGTYIADLDTEHLSPGTDIIFTFHWTQKGNWEGINYVIAVEVPD